MAANSLFRSAMNGHWNEVVEVYRNNPAVRRQKITASEDTVLHVAVLFGKKETVLELLAVIGEEDTSGILSLKNERGNTPLHLAAELGDETMCYFIATKDSWLTEDPNSDGETPLFLAALHGKQKAFFCLVNILRERQQRQGQRLQQPSDISLCRDNNGNTILHSAIFGQHFSLAIQIIRMYPDLVNTTNIHGSSPLHLLARMPTAFRSSSHLVLLDALLYKCLNVDQLVEKELQVLVLNLQLLRTQAADRIVNHLENLRGRRSIDVENPQPAEGCSRSIIKHFCAAAVSLLLAVLICARFLVNQCLKMATFGLLDMRLLGFRRMVAVKTMKTRHKLAMRLLNELVPRSSMYNYHRQRRTHTGEMQSNDNRSSKVETPILIAARLGVIDVVKKILDAYPVASLDTNSEHKNAVLLSAENRQTKVYKLLLEMVKEPLKEGMFSQLDSDGNSALHLAATFNDKFPSHFPEAATHMRLEVEWYRFVMHSMPPHFFIFRNTKGDTPDEIFTITHKELAKNGSEWLLKTSESCSLVAALIATVAFATSVTVPGGTHQENGLPIFEGKRLFDAYAISSLLALSFSMVALVYFLAIRTSRFKKNDFAVNLSRKLLIGLTSLFASIASILFSSCCRHFLMLENNLKQYVALPVYAITGYIVIGLAVLQLPFYFGFVLQFRVEV